MTLIIEIALTLAVILGAALLFVNAVEMLGERLGLTSGGVGSVLAAVGTALPETIIPIVAVVGAALADDTSGAASEIGIGAILGAPFLLATLAMGVVGASALGYRNRRSTGTALDADEKTIGRDLGFFLVLYLVAAGTGLVDLPFALRLVVALGLVAAYAVFVVVTLRSGGKGLEEIPERLTLWPFGSPPPTWAVVGQTVLALLVMIVGARLFVGTVEQGSAAIGIPAGLVALVLAPLATELPEKFNSVIWVGQDKDTLALGNVTGAMVFQSTVPVSLGILLTPWDLNPISLVSVVLALLGGGFALVVLRRAGSAGAYWLLTGAVLYVAFVVAAIVAVA